MFGQWFTFIALQCTNEMPFDGSGQKFGFREEFLEIVFAEVDVGCACWVGVLMQGEDVVCWVEFGDCDEAWSLSLLLLMGRRGGG